MVTNRIKETLKKSHLIVFCWRIFKHTIYFLKPHKKIKRYRPAIIQITSSFVEKDAIGNMISELSSSFAKLGKENYISAENCVFTSNQIPLLNLKFHKLDTIVYHMSIGSPASKKIIKAKVKNKIMIYHNITPAKYFNGLPAREKSIVDGRKELVKLKKHINLAICVSEYNENDLKTLGYKNTCVIPCIHRTDSLLSCCFEPINCEGKVFITVGRVAKNKCIEDVILLFKEYHKLNRNSSLFIIGKNDNSSYMRFLKKVVRNNEITRFVHFLGSLTESELASYYKRADAYICMSEHEGFCIPLIEAMGFNVPIFAYNSTAVPFTVKDAGIIFDSKNHVSNAKVIFDTLSDSRLLNKIRMLEANRYKEFDNKKITKKYLDLINFSNNNENAALIKLYQYANESHISTMSGEPMSFSLNDYLNLSNDFDLKLSKNRLSFFNIVKMYFRKFCPHIYFALRNFYRRIKK